MYNQLAPQQLAEMKGWFASLDKDRSGSITFQELSQAQFGGQKLSLVTAKMLVAVFDSDKSGNIGTTLQLIKVKLILTLNLKVFLNIVSSTNSSLVCRHHFSCMIKMEVENSINEKFTMH